MKNNLSMDFSVFQENLTIVIKREFSANLDMVWMAWTEVEYIEQWWAPKPWSIKTKSWNFVPGGNWIYAMVGPHGEEHWSFANFNSISPKTNYQFGDSFCDKNGAVNSKLPNSQWNIDFISLGELTSVDIAIVYNSVTDLEEIIKMGFREGISMAMNNLDDKLLELDALKEKGFMI